MALLEVRDLKKTFLTPDGSPHQVVHVPGFILEAKEQMALRGESGSGKTTFLNLIAGILRADSGQLQFQGKELTTLTESQRDHFRAEHLGYIFQTFNLIPAFTCLENVLLGMAFGAGVDKPFARSILKRVGLSDKMDYYPHQLSTGQQQRIAVARALANRPQLVLADEPTGNLDSKNAVSALALIREACQENEAALLVVSHDPNLLQQFDKVVDWTQINRPAPQVLSA